MKSYRPSRAPCPVGRASRLLGDRWVLLILREAFLGVDRFEQFVERLGINRAALTSRLTILQEAGLMRRDPPEGKRAHYVLTERAHDLGPLYREMAEWGAKHLFEEGDAPTDWPDTQSATSRRPWEDRSRRDRDSVP
ncbi:helix-turn-helix domain-containing protein [Erythrobacter sp. JK5]|uniref:winged helix-turn-helix transcriptional regulator n=1 Tax=Erythrobacter sp. JK5 TaxID=2829500 RepID=UPI001BA61F05|nr:helix-turn-helix domain-containing protein [Erythrobacter sp. JK5]QUL37168.1 helix-turn-helix transcriptional regulator [Erythrobacter sp. JK5]